MAENEPLKILHARKDMPLSEMKKGAPVGTKEPTLKEYFRESLEYQREEVALMKKGYKGFIQGESVRAHVNPEQYDQALPPWFESLSPAEQGMLRLRLNINYLAAVKRDTAMESFDDWIGLKGLRVERRALADMWKDMPGFRIVLATMVHDTFIEKDDKGRLEDHLVISGIPDEKTPTGGYSRVGSEERLNKYKADLIAGIAEYLHLNDGERVMLLQQRDHVDVKDIATAAVSANDNLFFALGSFDSADEKRKISPGDANVYSEQVRTLFMPGVKGKAKWLLETEVKEKKEKADLGVADEDFGGSLGWWIRDNIRHNRHGFAERVKNGQIRLIPERMFFSALDMTCFDKDYRYKTLAQALLRAPKKDLGNGLWDFEEDAIDINQLHTFELLGNYADPRSAAVRLYKHLTGNKEEDRSSMDQIINALTKLRKDILPSFLTKWYRDEWLIIALIVNAASPAGLVRGTDQLLLDIPELTYDSIVYNSLADNRIFEGMRRDFRKTLLAILHARDVAKFGSELFYIFPSLSDNMFSTRSAIRREADHNIRHNH